MQELLEYSYMNPSGQLPHIYFLVSNISSVAQSLQLPFSLYFPSGHVMHVAVAVSNHILVIEVLTSPAYIEQF